MTHKPTFILISQCHQIVRCPRRFVIKFLCPSCTSFEDEIEIYQKSMGYIFLEKPVVKNYAD